MNTTPPARRLFTFEFFAMCLIIVMAFANVSVFYSFYYYLGVIDIPVVWRGFLVGLEPMAAFAFRLLVVPWLHIRNAYAVAMAALVLLITVSCFYLCVTTVAGLVVLRIAHGAVFVLLTSATIALMVSFIPPERSGQGFSALSIAVMLPYVIIPPLTEGLLPYVRSAADIYAGVSVFSLAGIFLMMIVHGRIHRAMNHMDAVLMRRASAAEIRDNFKQQNVSLLLCAILFIYLAHATFFYFMKNLSLQTGVGNVGVFFSIAMVMIIAVRLVGAVLFDRLYKKKILAFALCALTVSLLALPAAKTTFAYYLLAAVYGGSIGIAVPVFNALLFAASAPGLRGLNTNMTLFAMDAGYFITPYLGGLFITMGAGFGVLFYAASGFTMAALALVIVMGFRQKGGNRP